MRRVRALSVLRLLRPHQWVKNGFVLIGVLFGHAAGDPDVLVAAFEAAAAFCLASSAVYAFNDCHDAARDREHPQKRDRPVANFELTERAALRISALLAIAGLALGLVAGWRVAAIILAYLAVNVAYTLRLKHVPVLEVALIASGFMLRILAGTLGVGLEPSGWLLACGGLLTLFLGFAKRRAEIAALDADAAQHREVLGAYGVGFLDGIMTLCAGAMVVLYALYTIAEETVILHGTGGLVLTVPFVLVGTVRMLMSVREGLGADPSRQLLRDPVLAGSAAGWLVSVLWFTV